jgi:hypothetical protein
MLHQCGARLPDHGALLAGVSVDAVDGSDKKKCRNCSCCFSFHVKTE